jgi:hypothetical protein
MKTPTQIYQQNERIYRKSWTLAVRNAAKADPQTQGNALMCHNWGNAESKAVWDHHQDRVNHIGKVFDRLYDQAEHVQNHGDHFRPMWCSLCQS